MKIKRKRIWKRKKKSKKLTECNSKCRSEKEFITLEYAKSLERMLVQSEKEKLELQVALSDAGKR